MKRLFAIVLLALGSGQAKADVIRYFSATGTFTNGDTLSGTVVLDATTGAVTAADLFASGPDTERFYLNVGNYVTNKISVIAADSPTSNLYPVLVIGTPTPSLVDFTGGLLVTQSEYIFADNSQVFLSSGMLTLDDVQVFDAYGLFTNGDSLGGTVAIDTVNGNVVGADLTATGPAPQTFYTNSGNYVTQNIAVITADSPTDSFYPVLVLGTKTNTLVGYSGGSLVAGSAYINANNSQVGLVSGGLTSTAPEPSTWIGGLSALLLGGFLRSPLVRKRGIARNK